MKTPPFRADHVGSLLRPKELTEARAKFRDGDISAAELRTVEDEAIKGAVKFQEDLGLKGVTDGEFRRRYFHVDFLVQLDGVIEEGGMAKKFQNAKGELDFAPPAMKVNDKVRHSKPIELENFKFLKSVASQTPKVTIPSPTMLHFRGGRNAVCGDLSPTSAKKK